MTTLDRRWKDAKKYSSLFRSHLKSCCCPIVKPSSVELAHHRPATHSIWVESGLCTYSEYSWEKFSISRGQEFLDYIHRLQTSDRCLSPQNRSHRINRGQEINAIVSCLEFHALLAPSEVTEKTCFIISFFVFVCLFVGLFWKYMLSQLLYSIPSIASWTFDVMLNQVCIFFKIRV